VRKVELQVVGASFLGEAALEILLPLRWVSSFLLIMRAPIPSGSSDLTGIYFDLFSISNNCRSDLCSWECGSLLFFQMTSTQQTINTSQLKYFDILLAVLAKCNNKK